MLIYCLKCQRNTENVDSKALKTKNSRTMLLSKVLYVVRKSQNL